MIEYSRDSLSNEIRTSIKLVTIFQIVWITDEERTYNDLATCKQSIKTFMADACIRTHGQALGLLVYKTMPDLSLGIKRMKKNILEDFIKLYVLWEKPTLNQQLFHLILVFVIVNRSFFNQAIDLCHNGRQLVITMFKIADLRKINQQRIDIYE